MINLSSRALVAPKLFFLLFILIPVHRPLKPYSLYVIYGGAVACKSGRSCQSPGVCFSSAQRLNGATPAPLTQPRGGEALGLLTLASARAHVWEAPWKRVYSVRRNVHMVPQTSGSALQGGAPSHVCFLTFLFIFKVK